MAEFATIPLELLADGWVRRLSDPALRVFLVALCLAKRRASGAADCGVKFELQRGEWMMSRNKLQEEAEIAFGPTFREAIRELGPDGYAFMDWRPTCEHQNAKTIWRILEPDLFVRSRESIQKKASKVGSPDTHRVGRKATHDQPKVGLDSTHPLIARARGAGTGVVQEKRGDEYSNRASDEDGMAPSLVPVEPYTLPASLQRAVDAFAATSPEDIAARQREWADLAKKMEALHGSR